MKIVHVPYSYFPDPVGGAEIYVQALARNLQRLGVDSMVCAPGAGNDAYFHSGLRVRRFAGVASDWPVEYSYDDGDPIAASVFGHILAREKPDLVHVHALTAQVSLRLAREVRTRGLPLVFTYHAAMASCQTGGLLRWGHQRCDGVMRAGRCSACNLAKLGMPRQLAAIVGHSPLSVGRLVGKLPLRGPAMTAMRMRELIELRHAAVREFLGIADAVVAPSRWVERLLLANGVPAPKIRVCAQGVANPATGKLGRRPGGVGAALKVAALCRLERTKGVHVLIEAMAADRSLEMTLDVYFVPQPHDQAYFEMVVRGVARDPRIRLLPAVPNEKVVETLANYDVLVVPSQISETGPLVVLEAFAAGIPVIGSDIGGISERVIHDRNGLLVAPFDRRAWTQELRRLAADPWLLRRLSRGITPPPLMRDVAAAMESLYREMTGLPLMPPRRKEA